MARAFFRWFAHTRIILAEIYQNSKDRDEQDLPWSAILRRAYEEDPSLVADNVMRRLQDFEERKLVFRAQATASVAVAPIVNVHNFLILAVKKSSLQHVCVLIATVHLFSSRPRNLHATSAPPLPRSFPLTQHLTVATCPCSRETLRRLSEQGTARRVHLSPVRRSQTMTSFLQGCSRNFPLHDTSNCTCTPAQLLVPQPSLTFLYAAARACGKAP
eukprot:766570-Hanusia_phi.AAC.7